MGLVVLKTTWTGKQIKTEYENNKKCYQEIHKNGQLQSIKLWHLNGKLEKTIKYKNGHPHGKEKWFSASGKKIMEIPYVFGNVHGVEKHWYDCGKPRMEIPYKNGIIHGIIKAWGWGNWTKLSILNGLGNKMGKWIWDKRPISYECQYVDGKEHGAERTYNKDGSLLKEKWYLFGEEVSKEEYRKFELIEELSGVKA